MMPIPKDSSRYARQIAFKEFGQDGQLAIGRGRVMIVGLGGLGSWTAELLARAGVGYLRLVDDDRVELANIQRQALYDECDARDRPLKVEAAAKRLAQLNTDCRLECVPHRVDSTNLDHLLNDIDVVVDGTDNFAARFLLNDACVAAERPWIFAGVMRCEAQAAVILPGRTACLRCLLEEAPPAGATVNCRQVGVMGMAVATVAAFQAMETVKLLAGRLEAVNPNLVKFDMWSNTFQRLRLLDSPARANCPCCSSAKFTFTGSRNKGP